MKKYLGPVFLIFFMILALVELKDRWVNVPGPGDQGLRYLSMGKAAPEKPDPKGPDYARILEAAGNIRH